MEKFNVLIDQNTLDKRISEIAEQISKDYINEEIILVCILKGAVYFATDLSKKITNNTVFLDFMKIKSYKIGARESSGKINLNLDLSEDIQNKNVIIVEDIIDSGNTLKYLYDYLKRTYIHADEYYELAIKAIDELNHSLQYFSTTTYNNLYLLNNLDYSKYSMMAVETQLDRETNSFTRQELIHVVNWLCDSKFYEGDYLNLKLRNSNECLIIDGDKTIPVSFETHFMDERLNG